MLGGTQLLNLPFKIPVPAGRFYETLPEDVQETLFRNYYELFKSGLKDGAIGHSIGIYISETDLMNAALEDGDESEIKSFLDYKETEAMVERTNPFTGEKVLVRGRTTDKLSKKEAMSLLAEEIKKRQEFLNSSEEILMEKFWQEEIEGFEESYLFEAASNLNQLGSIILEYRKYLEIQDVISRVRRRNLHQDYAAEAIKCKNRYKEAEEFKLEGNSIPLENLQKLSAEALELKSQGRRITSEGGPCYVCGKFVWPFDGELLLWNEIPKSIRAKYIPDVFQKWHIRHFGPECSAPNFGSRELFLHPVGPFEKRNTNPENCIVCGSYVSEESGWLIPVSLVPKWKQTRPTFPGAKTKNYYAVCGKQD